MQKLEIVKNVTKITTNGHKNKQDMITKNYLRYSF